ncbi:MAG: CpcT/CpeT family chromophore lyase [Gammaproteobacteria bacterium]
MMPWLVVASLLAAAPAPVLAQGQDSTPAERYRMILSELLPGHWDNANQAYFDRRRGLPDDQRHARVHLTIRRIEAPGLGPHAFLWLERRPATDVEGLADFPPRLFTLDADGPDDAVVMRHYRGLESTDAAYLADLEPAKLDAGTPGCEYLFRRRAGSFRGEQDGARCRFEWEGQEIANQGVIEVSEEDLLVHGAGFHVDLLRAELHPGNRIEPTWYERARDFVCYADLPGVGGGRDDPFERYGPFTVHDKGGSHWFHTREETPRHLGIALQSVTWQVLNEDNGRFNRDSLVVYVSERLPDGSSKEHGYAFTEPEAERIGVNLKWMLVNCSVTPPEEARPEL